MKKWYAPIPEDAEVLYRAEVSLFGTLDEFDNPVGCRGSVRIDKYYVVKKTPNGCWVTLGLCCPVHFVRTGARKRFAWPTEREALESLVARMRNYVGHCERRLKEAKAKLSAAEDYVNALDD